MSRSAVECLGWGGLIALAACGGAETTTTTTNIPPPLAARSATGPGPHPGDVAIEHDAACVARRDGTVWCWGTFPWSEPSPSSCSPMVGCA